jgi:hypothetical protein
VLGSLCLLAALALIGSAIAGIFGLETNRDASGYFVTHTHHYETLSYALSTEGLDVGGITGALEAGLVRLRLTATSDETAKPLFIGIARTTDVDRYLARSAHDELRDINFDPFDRLPAARNRGAEDTAVHPELLADACERHRPADDQVAGREGPVVGGRDERRRKPARRRRRAARRPPLGRLVVRRRVHRPRGTVARRRHRTPPFRPPQAGVRGGLTMTASSYPVRVEGELQPGLSPRALGS